MSVNIKILQAGDLDELTGLAAGRDQSASINDAQELSDAPRVVANSPLLYNFEGSGITSGAELFVDAFHDWDVPSEPEDIHTFKAMRVSYNAYNTKGVFSIDLGKVAAALLWPVADGAQTLQTETAERVFNRIGLGVRLVDNGATTFRSINGVIYTGVHQIGDPRGAGELQWRDGTPAPMVVIDGREFYYYIEGQGGGGVNTYELRDADTGAVLTWVIGADAEALSRSVLNADDLQGAHTVGAYKLLDEPVTLNHGSGLDWATSDFRVLSGAYIADGGIVLPPGGTSRIDTTTAAFAAEDHQGQIVCIIDVRGVSESHRLKQYQDQSGTYLMNHRDINKNGVNVLEVNNWNGHFFAFRNYNATGDILIKSLYFYAIRPELISNPNFRSFTDPMLGSSAGWALSSETASSRAYVKSSGGLALFGNDAYGYQYITAQAGRTVKLRYFIRANDTPTGSSTSVTVKILTSGAPIYHTDLASAAGFHEFEIRLPADAEQLLVMHQTNNTLKNRGIVLDLISITPLDAATVYDLDHPVLEDGSTTWPTAWTKYDDTSYRHVDKLTTGVKLTADAPNRLASISQQAPNIQAGDTVRVVLEWTGGDHTFAVDVTEYDGGTLMQTWTFNHDDTARHSEAFSFTASANAPTIRVDNSNAGDVLVHEVHARVTHTQAPELRQTGEYLTEPHCEKGYFLKWLDRDGIYRFGVFNSYATASAKIGEAVKTDNYIEYLSGADARTTVHSRAIDPTLALHKRRVSSEIYNHYESLAGSPKAYIQNGDGVWREVVVEWNPARGQDRNFHNIDIVVYLGSDYVQNV